MNRAICALPGWHYLTRAGRLLAALVLVGAVALLTSCAPAEREDTTTLSSAPPPPPTAGTRLEPPRTVANFTLTSHEGEPLSLSDLEGKIVLLYFGYTFCPDICPASLADFVHVKRNLGEQADQVAFVFVSVDGERDTPDVLARYLSAFDPQFIGLTGEEQEIRKIGVDYGLFFEKVEVEGTSADYLVDHTAASFLIDSERQLSVIYAYGTPPEVISNDILTFLAGSAAPSRPEVPAPSPTE